MNKGIPSKNVQQNVITEVQQILDVQDSTQTQPPGVLETHTDPEIQVKLN